MSYGCRLALEPRQVQHRGLLLDKFFPEKGGEKGKGADQQVREALTVLGEGTHEATVYRLAFERWKATWPATNAKIVRTQGRILSRMAIGLGAETAGGPGLRLHHTYGMPLIPGSSLKGLLRQSLPSEHSNATKERNVEWYLFGDEGQGGAATVHDAWWVPDKQSPLALDVITPHHQNYYGGSAAPTDFDQPVPVPFLSVRGSFYFVIEGPSPEWARYLKNLLRHALLTSGAGAKRSSGYGSIETDE